MIDLQTVKTIGLMALVTYATRALGYLALRDRTMSKRATAVMEAAPGCVLISVIAPHFVSDRPADLIALAVTVLTATRLSMLPTVCAGVGTAAALHYLMG